MPVPIIIGPMINQCVGIAFLRLIGARRRGGEERTAARWHEATRWRCSRRPCFCAPSRPRAHLEGYVETLKARLAVAEAVGGAGDCQGGEGRRPVRGARGRATSALMAVAHGLRLALPAAFPSTTPPRRFDRLSYRLKTSRSRTRRSRASASPSSRPQRSGRRATAARLPLAGELEHAGQQQYDTSHQHDDAQEGGDHRFDSSTCVLTSPKRKPRIALASHSSAFARQRRAPYGSRTLSADSGQNGAQVSMSDAESDLLLTRRDVAGAIIGRKLAASLGWAEMRREPFPIPVPRPLQSRQS
jgi:hypothetical protein